MFLKIFLYDVAGRVGNDYIVGSRTSLAVLELMEA